MDEVLESAYEARMEQRQLIYVRRDFVIFLQMDNSLLIRSYLVSLFVVGFKQVNVPKS